MDQPRVPLPDSRGTPKEQNQRGEEENQISTDLYTPLLVTLNAILNQFM